MEEGTANRNGMLDAGSPSRLCKWSSYRAVLGGQATSRQRELKGALLGWPFPPEYTPNVPSKQLTNDSFKVSCLTHSPLLSVNSPGDRIFMHAQVFVEQFNSSNAAATATRGARTGRT
ncbi:hypothetical protein VFPFJ_09932 [Purpureocillium lilacinum]|uniref:Uncharacterized protein n=1 Tax=Purpureocillium lilacinum TaxID=33203 RepID=A0A179GNF9_PURLI|nr:hypothetical protein VFPFJ_09932 [Purpureocillium lilacinum]OAQ76364.1 hypothetical protein VFPBJ_08724 [Purpureocillium lilacinum]OAQ79446.1 hypothetical protein VFPFJ_09932 [Purpureocillium lilacinum]